jgi:hypothetical protein
LLCKQLDMPRRRRAAQNTIHRREPIGYIYLWLRQND